MDDLRKKGLLNFRVGWKKVPDKMLPAVLDAYHELYKKPPGDNLYVKETIKLSGSDIVKVAMATKEIGIDKIYILSMGVFDDSGKSYIIANEESLKNAGVNAAKEDHIATVTSISAAMTPRKKQ